MCTVPLDSYLELREQSLQIVTWYYIFSPFRQLLGTMYTVHSYLELRVQSLQIVTWNYVYSPFKELLGTTCTVPLDSYLELPVQSLYIVTWYYVYSPFRQLLGTTFTVPLDIYLELHVQFLQIFTWNQVQYGPFKYQIRLSYVFDSLCFFKRWTIHFANLKTCQSEPVMKLNFESQFSCLSPVKTTMKRQNSCTVEEKTRIGQECDIRYI